MSMSEIFHLLFQIIVHTPPWVFLIPAYLAWQGWRQLSPTTMRLPRVVIIPVIFIVWGIVGLFGRPLAAEMVAIAWFGTAAIGAILGVLARPRRIAVDRSAGLVRRPGSVFPLLRNLVLFTAHYVINVAIAMRPDMQGELAMADIFVSGLSAGYFLGWLGAFIRLYRTAPSIDFAARRTAAAEASS